MVPVAAVFRQKLSLLAGVSIAQVLTRLGLNGHGLKWPNDLYVHGRKLGGVLIESGSDGVGLVYTVIGVGINIDLKEQAVSVTPAAIDLVSLLGEKSPPREVLVAELINALVPLLAEEGGRGAFSWFPEQWRQYDLTFLQTVQVTGANNRCFRGIGRGVDDRGCLLIQVGDQRVAVDSGEVSLRFAP